MDDLSIPRDEVVHVLMISVGQLDIDYEAT